jgi:hypothetical protein
MTARWQYEVFEGGSRGSGKAINYYLKRVGVSERHTLTADCEFMYRDGWGPPIVPATRRLKAYSQRGLAERAMSIAIAEADAGL